MTLVNEPFRKFEPNKSRLGANEWNRLTALVTNIARSVMSNGVAGGSGFSTRKTPRMNPVRLARTTEAAPATEMGSTTNGITCNLVDDDGDEITGGIDSAIEVYAYNTGGAANWNAVIPLLADDGYLWVTFHDGNWWSTTLFSASTDCDCYTAP